jgi:hypothetical protein
MTSKPQIIDRPLVLKNIETTTAEPNLWISADGTVKIAEKSDEMLNAHALRLEELEVFHKNEKASAKKYIEECIQSSLAEAFRLKKMKIAHGKRPAAEKRNVPAPLVETPREEILVEKFDRVLPNSGTKMGRLALNTLDEKLYIDLGYKTKRISTEKFEKDILISKEELKREIDLSDSDIDDATRAIWQICKNGDDFARIHCTIKTPSAKKVILELPEGSESGMYRLIGVE